MNITIHCGNPQRKITAIASWTDWLNILHLPGLSGTMKVQQYKHWHLIYYIILEKLSWINTNPSANSTFLVYSEKTTWSCILLLKCPAAEAQAASLQSHGKSLLETMSEGGSSWPAPGACGWSWDGGALPWLPPSLWPWANCCLSLPSDFSPVFCFPSICKGYDQRCKS